MSFTRRALHVARDRMVKKFGLGRADLPYFRTLHSMCYHLAGVLPGQVVDKHHIRELARILGLNFHGTGIKDEGEVEAGGPDSPLLFHENLARLTLTTMHNHAECYPDIDAVELQQFHEDYREFKVSRNLLDFTSILWQGMAANPPELDLLLVDEAQDLSPVQWLVVRHLARDAGEVVIAGDSNQAIYTWAGADVKYFVQLAGKKVVLPQGYRMACAPHFVAAWVADRIKVKHDADFSPRPAAGSVSIAHGLADIPVGSSTGDWLVLARTNRLLAQAKREAGDWWPDSKLSLTSIRFSTIHRAKGAEADNVVLLTGMSERCWRGYQDRPDDELRVWYVGVSRTRKNLYVVPSSRARYQMELEV